MARPTDQDLEDSVAGMLRLGVSLAAIVVFLGGVLLLRHPRAMVPSYTQFRSAGPMLCTIQGVVRGALHGRAEAVVQLGLLLLIATPVARVIFCVVGFARQRDKLYTAVSVSVLAILLYALTRGAK